MRSLACVLALFGTARALFSVQDDILAFPQYQITIADTISEEHASRLQPSAEEYYEYMKLEGERYVCAIPVVEPQTMLNASEKELSKTEEEKELVRAQASGWDLLEPLSGTCLYYIAGWWTYAFCHKVEVKQFHQLAPQSGPLYPPKEDSASEAYVLGRVSDDSSVAVQSAGEMRYLVQKVGGGSVCDLTRRERKIEIQFHCNQNSNDKIAWIKEVTTCRYLMVIHTPRLCHDPAFLPPKVDRANEIKCRRITDATNADATSAVDIIDIAIEDGGDEREKRTSPDLVTAVNMLIRDIERQMAQGEFLTPDGTIASDSDEFSYSVALVDVNGQVIGVVTVVVDNGKVQVELDEKNEVMLSRIPEKLKEDLREFSGGADKKDIEELYEHSTTSESTSTASETSKASEWTTQYRVVRDEL